MKFISMSKSILTKNQKLTKNEHLTKNSKELVIVKLLQKETQNLLFVEIEKYFC